MTKPVMHTISLIDHATNTPVGATSIPGPPAVDDVLYLGPRCFDILSVAETYSVTTEEYLIRQFVCRVTEGPASLPLTPEFDELASLRAALADEKALNVHAGKIIDGIRMVLADPDRIGHMANDILGLQRELDLARQTKIDFGRDWHEAEKRDSEVNP